jgi:hypothetical protein
MTPMIVRSANLIINKLPSYVVFFKYDIFFSNVGVGLLISHEA